jgi:hypothetical protein
MGQIRTMPGKAVGTVRIGDNANLNDAEIITLGSKIFEWDSNGAYTAGRIPVAIGATATISIINLVGAINANQGTVPVVAAADVTAPANAHIIAVNGGTSGNIVFTTTMVDADNLLSGVTLLGGTNAGAERKFDWIEYTFTALDVSSGAAVIPTGLASPSRMLRTVTTAGVKKAVTDTVLIAGSNIVYTIVAPTSAAAGDVFRALVVNAT